jgi:hypothetical protein
MKDEEIARFRILFIVAAVWNLIGAILGYFNTAYTFRLFFDRELADPLYHAIYQGAWGTTLVYFVGYLIVAKDPIKHTAVVILGGIGKVAFAIKLLQLYLAEIATPAVFVVIVGDFVFTVLFLWYFYRLFKSKTRII